MTGRAGLAYEFENGVTPYARCVASFFNPVVAACSTPNNKPRKVFNTMWG